VPLHSIRVLCLALARVRNDKRSNQHYDTNDETRFVAPVYFVSSLIATRFYRRNFPPRARGNREDPPLAILRHGKFRVTVPKDARTYEFLICFLPRHKRERKERDRLTSLCRKSVYVQTCAPQRERDEMTEIRGRGRRERKREKEKDVEP